MLRSLQQKICGFKQQKEGFDQENRWYTGNIWDIMGIFFINYAILPYLKGWLVTLVRALRQSLEDPSRWKPVYTFPFAMNVLVTGVTLISRQKKTENLETTKRCESAHFTPFPPFWGSTWISTPWQWRFLTVRKRLWWDPNFNVHISFRSASIPSTNGHLYVIPSFFQSSTPRKKRASIYLWLYHRFPPPKITRFEAFFPSP